MNEEEEWGAHAAMDSGIDLGFDQEIPPDEDVSYVPTYDNEEGLVLDVPDEDDYVRGLKEGYERAIEVMAKHFGERLREAANAGS